MAYIGNSPEKGNFRKADSITCSATATYNLLVGGVAVNPNQNQCIVSLNGVIQSSGNSYTIASSQITFASALTSSDVIDFILILGDTLDVGVPSDDSVGLAQLSATGSPSSSNFLRGDNSWTAVSSTTINNNADDRIITGSGTANTLEGEANLTFDGNDLTLANGNIVFGTASKGVYLGVTSATASNLLDDYEEGTFTPVLGGSGGTSGQSYGLQGGNYVKIGDRVFIDANTSLSTKGTITGNVQIQGLPFTSKSGSAYRASASHSYIHTWSLSSGETQLNSVMYDNSAVVSLGESDVNGAEAWVALTTSQVNNASEIFTSVNYRSA